MLQRINGFCPGCGKTHLMVITFDCAVDDSYIDVVKVWDEETMRYFYVMILPSVPELGNPMEIVLGEVLKEDEREYERLMLVCAEFLQDIIQQANAIQDMLN